jgi:hypothetical protein
MQSRVQGDERSTRRGPVFAGDDDELYVIAMLQHEENQTKPVKVTAVPWSSETSHRFS